MAKCVSWIKCTGYTIVKLNMYSINLPSSVIVGGTSSNSASQHEQAITSHEINTLI